MRRHYGGVVVLALLASGCSTGDQAVNGAAAPASAALGHVHGLGLDPEDGAVYAAAHTGVWRVPVSVASDGAWAPAGPAEQVAGRNQDTMGFTVVGPGDFIASGHPDPVEQPDLSPPHLGLVRSDDGAQTWQTVSLRGEVDFHDLDVAPVAGGGFRVVGYDATRGVVMVSDDSGSSWRDGARLDARDLAIDPGDQDTLYATTETGVVVSRDAGRSFAPLDGAPALLLVAATPAGSPGAPGLVGIDTAGDVWAGMPGGRWTHTGHVDRAPQALAVVESKGGVRLLVADDGGVTTSGDAGASWQVLVGTDGAPRR